MNLQSFKWIDLSTNDPNTGYNIFINILTKVINEICPEKNVTVSPKKIIREPWATKGLMKSSAKMNKLYKNSLHKSIDHPNVHKYKSYHNYYNKLKRVMKQNYYQNLLQGYRYNI